MAINENKIVNKIRMFYICFANNTLLQFDKTEHGY